MSKHVRGNSCPANRQGFDTGELLSNQFQIGNVGPDKREPVYLIASRQQPKSVIGNPSTIRKNACQVPEWYPSVVC
ncbi:MAG: hypothetical protein ACKVHE_36710 [Planctomycetales bacterium]